MCEGVIFVLGPNPLTCDIRVFAGWPAEALFISRNHYFYSVFQVFGNWKFLTCAAPPPTIFYLILRSPPSKTPKSAQKISQHGGQIVPFFLTPIFVVFLGHFWPKNAKPPFTLISVVPLLSPQTTIFPVFFCPCIQKKKTDIDKRGPNSLSLPPKIVSYLGPPPPKCWKT